MSKNFKISLRLSYKALDPNLAKKNPGSETLGKKGRIPPGEKAGLGLHDLAPTSHPNLGARCGAGGCQFFFNNYIIIFEFILKTPFLCTYDETTNSMFMLDYTYI